MQKKHSDTGKFPTDDQGRLIDPFTGELLVPVKELQEAAKRIPEERGKPADVWSGAELAEAVGLSESGAKKVIKRLREQATGDQLHVDYLGLQIPVRALVQYTTENNAIAYGIQHAWGEKIAAAYNAGLGEEKGKPAHAWSSKQLGEALGISTASAIKIIRNVKEQIVPEQPYVEYLGLQIPSEAIVQYRGGSRFGYGINQEWGEQLAKAFKSKKGGDKGKPIDVWSADELAAAMGLVRAHAANFIRDFRNQFATGSPHVEYLGLQIPCEAIVKYRTDRSLSAYGIQKTWGEKLAAVYKADKGEERGVPPGILSPADLGKGLGLSTPSGAFLIKELRDQFKKDQPHANYRGLQIPATAIVKYTAENGITSYGLEQEWGKLIIAAYKAEKGETIGKPVGIWSVPQFAEAMGLSAGHGPKILKILCDQFGDGRAQAAYLGLQIPSSAIVRYTAQNGMVTYGIQQEWGERIAIAYKAIHGGERGKPEGVWSSADLATAAKWSESYGSIVIGELRDQFVSGKSFADYLTLKIPKEAIVEYRSISSRRSYGIREEWGRKVIATYEDEKRNKTKPENYWSLAEFRHKLNGRDSRVIAATIRKMLNEAGTAPAINYRGVSVPKDVFISYISEENGNPAWAIRSDIGQQIVDSFPKIDSKPDDVWSSVELGGAMGLKKDSDAIKRLKAYFDANEDAKTATVFGIEIPRTALVDFDLRGDIITGIGRDYGLRVAQAYKHSRETTKKPESALSMAEFADAMDSDLSTAKRITIEIQTALNQRPPTSSGIEYLGIPIPDNSVVTYEYNGRPTLSISKIVAQKIAEIRRLNLRPKPENVWSSVELAREMGIEETGGHGVIAKLVQQVKDNPESRTVKYREVDIPKESLVEYDGNAGKSMGITADASRLIVQAHRSQKIKPPGVWSSGDFDKALYSKHLGMGIIAMIRKQFTDPLRETATVKGIEIPRAAFVGYEHNGRPAAGIQEEYARKLLLAYGVTDQTEQPLFPVKDLGNAARQVHKTTQKRVQKTSPAEKVGDADESKLPEDVRGQLDQKRKNQREK